MTDKDLLRFEGEEIPANEATPLGTPLSQAEIAERLGEQFGVKPSKKPPAFFNGQWLH